MTSLVTFLKRLQKFLEPLLLTKFIPSACLKASIFRVMPEVTGASERIVGDDIFTSAHGSLALTLYFGLAKLSHLQAQSRNKDSSVLLQAA